MNFTSYLREFISFYLQISSILFYEEVRGNSSRPQELYIGDYFEAVIGNYFCFPLGKWVTNLEAELNRWIIQWKFTCKVAIGATMTRPCTRSNGNDDNDDIVRGRCARWNTKHSLTTWFGLDGAFIQHYIWPMTMETRTRYET